MKSKRSCCVVVKSWIIIFFWNKIKEKLKATKTKYSSKAPQIFLKYSTQVNVLATSAALSEQ